jgi:ubiquinone/menaquinone biosynthesis C-methylase UbiE
MRARVVFAVRQLMGLAQARTPVTSVSEYWNRHNVTDHRSFTTAEDSLRYFHWRNSQYANYLALMPVSGFDDRRVLDYGCGPGHDLVGFGVFSKPAALAGADVSASSIREARARLVLHGIDAALYCIRPGERLPFEDDDFDHVHSSGVLHHVEDPIVTLKELKRVLRPGGTMNVMVYNFDSVWTHLLVAYHRTIVAGRHGDLTLREQFARSTDGEECPISRCYTPEEFIRLANSVGFEATFAGAAISMHELSLLPTRFQAIMDERLPDDSRRFLESLEFDRQQLPLVDGRHAGVDAVYHLRN